MDAVTIPYLPTGLWILASALTILILLLVFVYHLFYRKRVEAVRADLKDLGSLASAKEQLQCDVKALQDWIVDQKEELIKLQAERQEQEAVRVELARLQQECAAKDMENQSLRNEVGELENQRHLLSQSLEKLSKEIGDLESKRVEAQAIEGHLTELRTKLEEARKKAHDFTKEAKDELAEARKEKIELDVIVCTLRHEQTALGRDVERKEQEIDNLKSLIQTATEEARQHAQLANEVRAKAESADRELADIRRYRQGLEIDVSELNARKALIEQELSGLGPRPSDEEDPLAAYADLLIKAPTCLSEDAFIKKREVQEETYLLQQLKNKLQKEGLVFSSRLINAFHTSLKCHDINPITVLAGVSGTGKTLLPMRYAEIMGMHRLVMAVQPRWDSPQDMFGFYNYLEKEYKATELSRSLVRMDPYNYKSKDFPMLNNDWTKDRLLLILLDEMNIARTEYYFSEFLSKLELRREVSDPSVAYKRSQAEIELDAGPGKHRFRLWVGHNVFFVGTLNEDETTQTLSDKVLDRANVIRFGKPDEKAKASKHNAQVQAPCEHYLSFKQWSSWLRDMNEGSKSYERVVGWTQRLNAALDRVGRPFGFRVQQAIGQYVANYPRVDDGENYKLAFADQVEQKIMTKLRGIDIGEMNANECLDEVEAIIDELGDNELGDSFASARTESNNFGMFQWRGVTRRMKEDNS